MIHGQVVPVGNGYGTSDDRAPDWRGQAACRGGRDGLWFSTAETTQEIARQICSTCPVAAECLDLAMAAEGALGAAGRFGIFGGMTPTERARMARQAIRRAQRVRARREERE